jgi:hypothetical protein
MLAVFVIWGLDTEGYAENPVFNLCWGRRKRVGGFLNLLIMKFEKINSKKFAAFADKKMVSIHLIRGGDESRKTNDVDGNCLYMDTITGGGSDCDTNTGPCPQVL